MAKNENNIQKEYKSLLASIKPSIFGLNDAKDATQCLLWLARLDDVPPVERAMRNVLLLQLRDSVMRKRLSFPFTESPPEGSLSQLMLKDNTARLSARSTAGQRACSLDPNDVSSALSVLSPDDGVQRYQQRAKEYKAAISRYQAILKNILQSSQLESEELEELSANWKPYAQICKCDAEDGTNDVKKGASGKPPEKNSNLKKAKSVQLPAESTKASKKDQDGRKEKYKKFKEKMLEKFHGELQKVVDMKDEIITRLEGELKNQTLQSQTAEHEQLEQTVLEKCNSLEKKYQQLLDDTLEQHKKDREADNKMIERLQNMLLTVGLDEVK